jgi:hypothetical protein
MLGPGSVMHTTNRHASRQLNLDASCRTKLLRTVSFAIIFVDLQTKIQDKEEFAQESLGELPAIAAPSTSCIPIAVGQASVSV